MTSPFSTIVAQASGAGRAGVAVLRLSGTKAHEALRLVSKPNILPSSRQAVLRDIVDYRNGTLLDHALVILFDKPNSFTGEDVVELHVHGGHAVVKAVLDVLCSIDGVEPAGPGDFSRRAFENDKMDLTEAEAIADLVDAETAAQRKQALAQMDGELGRLYTEWAERLTHILALTEAEIDFVEEEDIPREITTGRTEALAQLAAEINAHLNDNQRGEKLRAGFTVALLGAPNAGKSSLLNALTRRETAIVAPTPGTTRDVIEASLDLGGYPVTLADTAGLREAVDEIESEGVRRALARAEQADFKILLFDANQGPQGDKETKALADSNALIVVNKIDKTNDLTLFQKEAFFQNALYISAKTGDGVAALVSKLVTEIEQRFVFSDGPALTRQRHRQALTQCAEHLARAEKATQTELRAEDIRLAVRALGRITGRIDVEDLLDMIFSSFCIGK